jgi:hypothetical protein
MLGPIVVALLLSAPSPAASIAPGTPAHEACTTLRENVRTALAGLMKNDEIIENGRKAYQKMATDRATRSRDVAIDRLYVENAIAALVHNLAVVDDQLADPTRFPPGSTSSATSTTAMKLQLTAIAAQQKKALDLLSGALETSNFDAMQSTNEDGPTIAHSRSSLSTPAEVQDPASALGVGADAPDNNVADEISQHQVQLQALESKAAMTVMSAAAACNGLTPPSS